MSIRYANTHTFTLDWPPQGGDNGQLSVLIEPFGFNLVATKTIQVAASLLRGGNYNHLALKLKSSTSSRSYFP